MDSTGEWNPFDDVTASAAKSDNDTYNDSCDVIIYRKDFSNTVYIVTSTACVIVGLLGNALSISVFSASPMSGVSSSVYLLGLALSDALYLVTVFLGKTLTFLRCFGYVRASADIVNTSEFACVTLQYLSDLFSNFSTCLILAFTVERWVAVYLPTRWKALCTVPRARGTAGTVFAVVAVLICPHHVLFVGLYRNPDICALIQKHESVFSIAYFLEMLLFRILPVSTVAILNLLIVIRLGRISRKKKKKNKNKKKNCIKNAESKNDRFRMTAMLIIVSTTYIFLHIPVLVHFVVTRMYRVGLVDLTRSTIFTTQNYARSMYLVGFAVNFFLYTMGGKAFRQQLVQTLRCGRRRRRGTKEEEEEERKKMRYSATNTADTITISTIE